MSDTYVPTLNIHEAVLRFREYEMSISENVLSAEIEQVLYPFAICIRTKQPGGKERRRFEIYAKLLDEYLAARSGNGTANRELINAMAMLKNTISEQGSTTDKFMADFSSVPDFVKDELLELINKDFEIFFKQPDIQEKFEKWIES